LYRLIKEKEEMKRKNDDDGGYKDNKWIFN
jgi:hypothetical protein